MDFFHHGGTETCYSEVRVMNSRLPLFIFIFVSPIQYNALLLTLFSNVQMLIVRGENFIFTFQVYLHEPPKVKCKTKVTRKNFTCKINSSLDCNVSFCVLMFSFCNMQGLPSQYLLGGKRMPE